MKRYVLLLGAIVGAVAVNLLTTRWGTDLSASPVMTISVSDTSEDEETGDEITGLFAATWLEHTPWLAFGLGVLLPMGLLGTGVYFLVRPVASSDT